MKTLRFQDRGRATTDPRWDCGKSLWSERPRIAACSNPLQVRIARLNGKGGSVTRRAVYSFLRSSYQVQQGAGDGSCARMTDPRILPRLRLDISGVK
jgi:hypothetical protein